MTTRYTSMTAVLMAPALALTLILTACSAADTPAAPQNPAIGQPDLTRAPAPSEPAIPAGSVEVTLKDDLDGNLNGYCLDILGGGQNIDPAGGLQAHTCYSYRGALGSDQAVNPALMSNGTIKLPAFDVCAVIDMPEIGSKVMLESCAERPEQKFIMAENGTISPSLADNLCFTAGVDTVRGRNGTSPHQIKTLTLQPCEASNAAYQEWRTREVDD